MRTTLTLDDDVLELAARQAKLRGVSLGKTVSDLLRKGLNASTPAQEKYLPHGLKAIALMRPPGGRIEGACGVCAAVAVSRIWIPPRTPAKSRLLAECGASAGVMFHFPRDNAASP